MKKDSIEDWVRENISPSERKEVLEHGCVSGCVPDLIYYRDTCAFYEKYQEDIWDKLENTRVDMGLDSILHLVASFNGYVGSDDQFRNLLAWWAVEATCFELQEREEAA